MKLTIKHAAAGGNGKSNGNGTGTGKSNGSSNGTGTGASRIASVIHSNEFLRRTLSGPMGELREALLQIASGARPYVPRIQVRETKDTIVVSAALPGIDDGSLEVAFDGPLLKISGSKTEQHEQMRRRYRRTERVYRTFQREIPLPGGVDIEGTVATLRKEVLRINIPKAAAGREPARSVPVTAESPPLS